MSTLFVGTIIFVAALSVYLTFIAASAFWTDYGQVKYGTYLETGRKYPVGEIVQDFLFHDPRSRGRSIMICNLIATTACAATLVWAGGQL